MMRSSEAAWLHTWWWSKWTAECSPGIHCYSDSTMRLQNGNSEAFSHHLITISEHFRFCAFISIKMLKSHVWLGRKHIGSHERWDLTWCASVVRLLWAQISLPCFNSRWKPEVPLPNESSHYWGCSISQGPYGCSFFCICKTTQPKGEREIWTACALDWGIAMLCTWVQREGFSDFLLP